MFSEFANQSLKIIDIIENQRHRFGVVGSELLLYAISKLEDGSCKFIFKEYGITADTIERELNKLVILRKNATHVEYTIKFIEIINNSKKIASQEDSKYVFEEHICYAMLSTPSSIALHIIEKLGVDVSDLLEDLNNVFDFGMNNDPSNNYLINITKEAKLNRLNPFIGRKQAIDKIIRILSKKQKNNPMLIGSAGVGKSALVEGVAMKYLETNPNINIYRLDLGMVIAGTKYRGDLEERLLFVIDKIKNPNSIIFIDEIHNIVGSGSSEGTLDIANILKPILARSEIKCIGATTLEEYYKYIEKDKALSRRFQNVFIDEASPEEALEIIKGIAYKYEEFHKVKYFEEILNYIISSSSFLQNRKLPDKAIDILDEAGLVCKLNNRNEVLKEDVDKIIYESLGLEYQEINHNIEKIKYYHNLEKYYRQYFMNLQIRTTILNVETTEDNLDLLLEDLKLVFNIKDEVILSLDLSKFHDAHYASSLIGSPAGYVGYEEGGILTEHVIKFPISVVILKNYEAGNSNILKQIETILKEGKVLDSKGRLISFKNTIFVFISESKHIKIGFMTKENENTVSNKINPYIDEILKKVDHNDFYFNKIKTILTKMKDFNYNIVLNIAEFDKSIYSKLVKELSNFDNLKPNRKYIVKYENNKILIEKRS